jgi:hypothetical protein
MKRECTVTVNVAVMVDGQRATDEVARDVESVVMTALEEAGYEPVSRGATAAYATRAR